MIGPGKYDALVTDVRERTMAHGVILLVLGGVHGDGFSAQMSVQMAVSMPDILRKLANDIEASIQNGTSITTTE